MSQVQFEIVLVYVLQGLYVEKLKPESYRLSDTDRHPEHKPDPYKYPKNYTTCMNFFQLLEKAIKIPGMGRGN